MPYGHSQAGFGVMRYYLGRSSSSTPSREFDGFRMPPQPRPRRNLIEIRRSAKRALRYGRALRLGPEFDRHQLGNPCFLHRNAVHCLRRLHRFLGMRDHDELRVLRHLPQKLCQTQNISFVERCIHLIQYTKRTRLVAENRHE